MDDKEQNLSWQAILIVVVIVVMTLPGAILIMMLWGAPSPSNKPMAIVGALLILTSLAPIALLIRSHRRRRLTATTEADERRRQANIMAWSGAIIASVGAIGTIVTYLIAAWGLSDGKYYLFYGAIIYGTLQFFRGLSRK